MVLLADKDHLAPGQGCIEDRELLEVGIGGIIRIKVNRGRTCPLFEIRELSIAKEVEGHATTHPFGRLLKLVQSLLYPSVISPEGGELKEVDIFSAGCLSQVSWRPR